LRVPILTPDAMRIVNWLGELGPRWGLPGDACRIHALLFLLARPVSREAITAELALEPAAVDVALVWLAEDRLAVSGDDGWSTDDDPWILMTRALDARRRRELASAHAVLETWRGRQAGEDPIVARQAQRLFDLIGDVAAIDAGAQRLSPDTVRRMIGIGGRAARLVNRTFGKRSGT
jgi:hypothetical protein